MAQDGSLSTKLCARTARKLASRAPCLHNPHMRAVGVLSMARLIHANSATKPENKGRETEVKREVPQLGNRFVSRAFSNLEASQAVNRSCRPRSPRVRKCSSPTMDASTHRSLPEACCLNLTQEFTMLDTWRSSASKYQHRPRILQLPKTPNSNLTGLLGLASVAGAAKYRCTARYHWLQAAWPLVDLVNVQDT